MTSYIIAEICLQPQDSTQPLYVPCTRGVNYFLNGNHDGNVIIWKSMFMELHEMLTSLWTDITWILSMAGH